MAATNGDYRSVSSGNWNSTSAWEKFNGTSWVAISSTPSSADGEITISTGHVITISADVTADQITVNTGASLAINTSQRLTLADGTGTDLVVNGTLNINGELKQDDNAAVELNGTAVLSSSGSSQINSGATFTINNGGTFTNNGGSLTTSSGKWIVNSGGTFQHGTNGSSLPQATWNTGSTCLITGVTNNVPSNLNQTFYNFKWNCISQSANCDFSGNLTTVNGDFTVANTGIYFIKLKSGTSTINIGRNYVQSGGTFNLSSSNGANPILNISGDLIQSGGALCAGLGNGCIGSINVSGSWTLSGGTVTSGVSPGAAIAIVFGNSGTQTYNASGNSISGKVNYTVNSGTTLNLGTSILSGSGNFTLQSGAGLMISSANGISSSGASGNIQVTGTRSFSTGANYIYNGTSAQNTGSGLPSTINNLTIDNSSGLTLSANVTVSGTLTMSSGKITTGSYELKTANTSASSVTGYSASNYVIGNLRRSVSANGSYDFPVGTSSNYELINVTLSDMTGFTEILSSFNNESPINVALPLINLSVMGTEITDMLDYGYWTLTPNSIMLSGTYSVTLNEKGHSNAAGDAHSYCVLKRENALFSWQSLGTHNNETQSEISGVAIAMRTGLTSFSQFGIGKAAAPLPVELVYFSARPEGSAVKCEWQTASEVNNDFFTIERSQNGKTFTSAGTQGGAGNSNTTLNYSFSDETPLKGISYYRLKQTDFDGKFSYSKIKAVTFSTLKTDAAISISAVAPNPFSENFSVTYSVQQDTEVEISLTNASGQLIYNEKQNASSGTNRFDYAEGLNLPEGIYFVRISFGKDTVVKKIIKN